MAHSIQVMGGRAEAFDDLDLIALLGLLGLEVESAPHAHLHVAPLIAVWQRDLETYAPGTIELNLEAVKRSAAQEAELALLLDSVARHARRYGRNVPAQVLSSRCKAPGVTFFDYPAARIHEAIRRLRDMIGLGRAEP